MSLRYRNAPRESKSERSTFLHQPSIVRITLCLIIVIVLTGIINAVLALMTFQSRQTRQVGCGYYLYASTVTSSLTALMLIVKFSILLCAQMLIVTDRLFLNIQCYSFDYLLAVCLNLDRWLKGMIASERAINAIKGTNFNKKKSIRIAKYMLSCLILVISSSIIYDPIHRRLVDDDGNDEQKRIWCIVSYSSSLLSFNQFIHICHFLIPLILNILSPLIIIILATKRRRKVQTDLLLHQILYEQIHQNRHLLISPGILVLLSLPRLIISFVAGCMQSNSEPWLYLIGYLVSFGPSMLIFVIFVLPSELYTQEFKKAFKQYQRTFRERLSCLAYFSD